MAKRKQPPSEAVAEAYKHFNVNPNESGARDKLLEAMAARLFRRKKPGRPRGSRKWTDARLIALGLELAAIASAEGKEFETISEAANALLKQRGQNDYPSFDSIRKRFSAIGPASQKFWEPLRDDQSGDFKPLSELKRQPEYYGRAFLIWIAVSPTIVQDMRDNFDATQCTTDQAIATIDEIAQGVEQALDDPQIAAVFSGRLRTAIELKIDALYEVAEGIETNPPLDN
jgi:hypothetical protein